MILYLLFIFNINSKLICSENTYYLIDLNSVCILY